MVTLPSIGIDFWCKALCVFLDFDLNGVALAFKDPSSKSPLMQKTWNLFKAHSEHKKASVINWQGRMESRVEAESTSVDLSQYHAPSALPTQSM